MDALPSKRILIIEDDQSLASSLKRFLEFKGFAVDIGLSGEQGLVTAAEHRPDLIVLDLKLPDMHGFHVCREVRKLYHAWSVPIIMLTGLDAPIDQLRGFAYGADAYLTKPCPSEELLKTIQLILGDVVSV